MELVNESINDIDWKIIKELKLKFESFIKHKI